MKRSYFLFISILLISVIVISLVGCSKDPLDAATEYDISFDDLGVAPVASVVASTTSVDESKILKLNEDADELSEDRDVLETISYLYNLANENLMAIDYYASIAFGKAGVLIGDNTDSYAYSREYIVKDGSKWFFQNYTYDPTANSIIKGVMESSEERYTSDSGNTIYKRHGGSDSLSETCIEDFLTDKSPIIYSKMAKSGKKHAPKIYTMDTYNEFKHVRVRYDEIDNALINADTLVNGKVTYNADKGLYTIEFNVNISNDSEALENGRKNLSAAGGTSVYYEKQHQVITIWNSGLFCSYHTDNLWRGKFGLVTYGSANDYQKWFTYNKANVKKLVIPSDTSWTANCSADEDD